MEQPRGDTAEAARQHFPCSPAQRRFWLAEQATALPVNNIVMRWEILGTLSDDSMQAAAEAVLARHEALRTGFDAADGTPRQVLHADVPFRLGLVDLRGLPESRHRSRLDAIARELGAARFDPGRPPLLRMTLARLAPERAVLIVVAHHLVFDGASAAVLAADLGSLCAAAETGRAPDLPPLALQYPDYALWQAELAHRGDWRESPTYWARHLSGMGYFTLAPDIPAAPPDPPRPARIDRPLAPTFAPHLAAAAQRHGTTPFAVAAAAFAAALARASGRSDIGFATVIAARDEPDLAPLIGAFVNTAILRVDASGAPPMADMLARTTQALAGALAHSDLPFEEVLAALPAQLRRQRSPGASVLFGIAPEPPPERDFGPFRLRPHPAEAAAIGHDIAVTLIRSGEGWRVLAAFDAARIPPRRAEALIAATERAVAALALHPERPLAPETDTVDPVPERATSPRPAGETARDGATGGSADPRLRRIWAEALGLAPETCDGDFFDLGGHSLLALHMLARIEAEFGFRPGLDRLLADPTLAGLARALDAARPAAPATDLADPWEVLTLKPGQPDAPLVCAFNQPFLYLGVARAIEGPCRVMNLHLHGAPGDLADWGALVRRAAEHLDLAAPGGAPVLLLGNCVDGLLALHVAGELRARGRAASVAMIDTWAPGSPSEGRMRSRLRRWRHGLRDCAAGRIGVTRFLADIAPARRLLVAAGRLSPPTAEERRARAVNAALIELAPDTPCQPPGGPVLLFATEAQTARALHRGFGWHGPLGADLPVYPLEGWHERALTGRGTARLAQVLSAHLSRVEGAPQGTTGARD